MIPDNITRKLTAWKDALIDLSRRNPLLSLPTRSVLRFADTPAELWALPESGAKRLWFLTEKIPGTETLRSLKVRERAVNPLDYKILHNLRLKSNFLLNEQGVNVLFMVLGVLEWYDPRIGSTLRSPLLMVPAMLTALPGKEGFILSRLDEEVRINPTLRFRFAQPDIGLALPDADLDDPAFTPADYFARVAQAVAAKPNWRVLADESLLGRFSYLNLVMYEELDQRMDEMRAHPLIAAIAGDTAAAQSLPTSEPPPLDSEPPQKSFSVLPADPSQERAILAARYGQNLVIQGPPGTGKTQTITNLIATCIADGRRVLFVSEKMAALKEVYKRLQDCGLADLCLEAHSHKANKQEVLEQLRKSLEDAPPTVAVRNAEMSVLATLRDDFNSGVSALHEPREPLGLSVYEAHGIVAHLAEIPDYYFALDRAETVDADTYHAMERLAERLAVFHDLFPHVETRPWRGLLERRFSQGLSIRVREAITDLLKVTDALEDHTARLWSLLGLPERDSAEFGTGEADWLLRVVERLGQVPRPPAAWLTETDETLAGVRRRAVETQERFRSFEDAKAALLAVFLPEVLTLPHSALAERMSQIRLSLLVTAFGSDWADTSDAAFAQADTAMKSAIDGVGRLEQSAGRLASLCGFSAPPVSLAKALFQEQVVLAALNDPKPQAGWFAPGGIASLRARAQEAQQREAHEKQERAAVALVFTDALYDLDLEALRDRFSDNYASWTRIFKGAYHIDRKTLTSVLAAGASLKGRNVADDLRRPCRVRELKRQINADAEGLRVAFGGHNRGWNEVFTALNQTEALIAALGGSVPRALQERLIASGGAMQELGEQYRLVAAHLRAVEAALADAQQKAHLSGSVSQPVSQIPLTEIVREYQAVRPVLADYEAARRTVRRTHRQPETVEAITLRNGLLRAAHVAAEEAAIAEESEDLRQTYAHLFSGLQTDWTAVLSALDHAERLRRVFAEVGREVPAVVIDAAAAASGEDRLPGEAAHAVEAILPLRREWERVWRELPTLWDTLYLRSPDGSRPLEVMPFDSQRAWAENRFAAFGQMERWLDFETVREQCDSFGLLSFCEVMVRRCPPAAQIALIFRKSFHQRWLEGVAADSPKLASLCAAEHTAQQAKFERLDRAVIADSPGRIRTRVQQRRELVLGAGGKTGEIGFLRRILSQRRPRASVRKILSEIPTALFRLKPCLMMSPLSVSLFLDPKRIEFDIVIFDEASQIFPEYALGPLLRAGQAVIAGDSKQLPPTSFFKGMQDGDGSTADDEDEESAQAADPREFESILDAAKAPLAEAALTWHYRSRHESLIAFSNEKFYHGKLKTFPSARLSSAVSLEYVPDGVYYGGKGNPRNNLVEAIRVADLVETQVRQNPKVSVGVITMSEAQQECIRAEIERRTSLDSTLSSLLNEERLDGFFIKNIENVQGDERDVIFVSIGYGKWADGRVRMLFGPINRSGGERRLNVAITRAKEKLVVVSSLLPEEITLSDTSASGTRLLREYLAYARAAATTGMDTVTATNDELVEAVARALEARGHTIRRRVGLSDYRIDLAIVDPEQPDTFLLGIECDSSNYQSGETARAREWLRAGVLKSLGWRLYRLWSADWTRNRAAALQSLENALTAPAAPATADVGEPVEVVPVASPAAPEPTSGEAGDTESEDTSAAPPETGPAGLLPGLRYFEDAAGLALPGEMQTLYGETRGDSLTRAEFVDSVVQKEGPVHGDVIAVRLSRAAGLQSTGSRIKRIAEDTISLLEQVGRIERCGDFLWIKGSEQVLPRVPAPSAAPRWVEQISIEEIAEVALVILKNAIGMQIEEAINETARCLGYERTGTAIKERIGEALSRLEYDTRIHNFHGQLRPLE